MWSGRQTLVSIDDALEELRREVHELDDQIEEASKALVRQRTTETGLYRTLARLRLEDSLGDRVAADLDQLQRRVAALLEVRDQTRQELQQRIEASEQARVRLEAEREAGRDRVAKAEEALDQAEAGTQQRLNADPDYHEQLEEAQRSDAMAARAEEKTEQAEADRVEKGRPYEADPLFHYLWQRGYGTSRYSAGPLTRFFDGWVARLCDFSDARPNYAMLQEIPLRLREHAERLRRVATAQREALEARERAAAEADGIPALRQAVDRAEQELDAIDTRIGEAESASRALLEERSAYASGEDEYFRRAVETIAQGLRREPLGSLLRHAEETPRPDDDVAVQDLIRIDSERAQLEDTLARHKDIQHRHAHRLHELEDVRRRFKRNRYDGVHSTFADGSVLATLLREFLRGFASSDDLWRALERQHRYRRIQADPGFGSGGLGLPGKVWRLPMPRGGGWGGGFGRRGGGWGGGFSRGGGGFRTGGSF